MKILLFYHILNYNLTCYYSFASYRDYYRK